MKLIPQIILECLLTLLTIADIASLVTGLIVDLPGHNGLFILIMFHQGADDLLRIVVHGRTVKAVHMAPAKGTLCPVLKF